jgi:predicted MFS family arabinose efflux permease
MQASIWVGIFIGATIGGLIPELWGGDMISYSGVMLSGVGAFADCGSGRASVKMTETTITGLDFGG